MLKKQIQMPARNNKQNKYQAANTLIFLNSIKLSGKTLKFDNIEVNKK